MIISIKKLLEMCVEETCGAIPINEFYDEYHLRFDMSGLSAPVNEIKIDTTQKSIELSFNPKNILKGMDTHE